MSAVDHPILYSGHRYKIITVLLYNTSHIILYLCSYFEVTVLVLYHFFLFQIFYDKHALLL